MSFVDDDMVSHICSKTNLLSSVLIAYLIAYLQT